MQNVKRNLELIFETNTQQCCNSPRIIVTSSTLLTRNSQVIFVSDSRFNEIPPNFMASCEEDWNGSRIPLLKHFFPRLNWNIWWYILTRKWLSNEDEKSSNRNANWKINLERAVCLNFRQSATIFFTLKVWKLETFV